MFETLCRDEEHKFLIVNFINKQKFPYLRKPNEQGEIMEPYFHIFGNDKIKLNPEFKFEQYMPILSLSSTNEYADIIPHLMIGHKQQKNIIHPTAKLHLIIQNYLGK